MIQRYKPKFFDLLLQALLVIFILVFVLCSVWMFITGNAGDVLISGALALDSLVNAVGIILIIRWNRIGLWFCLAACLLECVALFAWGITIPLPDIAPSIVNSDYLPFVFPIGLLILIAAPLFMLPAQPDRVMIWKVMQDGFDVEHSRHIYQLTGILFICVAISMSLWRPDSKSEEYKSSDPDPIAFSRDISYVLLDSADVTLDEISVIEGMIDSIPGSVQYLYSKRIFALKHVLLSGLMAENHNVKNLNNIFKIHTGEFSDRQEAIIEWFVSLSAAEQELWLECPSVDNFLAFENELKQRINIPK